MAGTGKSDSWLGEAGLGWARIDSASAGQAGLPAGTGKSNYHGSNLGNEVRTLVRLEALFAKLVSCDALGAWAGFNPFAVKDS